MSSRTHKKTGLRNSNDIMFAPLFSRRKGATVDAGEKERVGRGKEDRPPRRGLKEGESEGLKGKRVDS